MSRWDVFVLPSVAETFGIVLLEAMHASIPIVATRVGGVVDVVEHNKTGLLVEPRKPHALALAINKIFSHPDLASEFVRNSRHRVKTFDWSQTVTRFEDVYNKLSR
ncbi:MAG: D-inositol 3-phosphate glycosyltransferase [bacterium ADurb.Bin400]|nr:MAG: D-inositol 3-phosphate glycosyltransferase [bacterium ADurb.Bin400]